MDRLKRIASVALATVMMAAAFTAGAEDEGASVLALDFGSRDALAGFTPNDGGFGVVFSGDVKFITGNYPDPLLGDCAEASGAMVTGLDEGRYRAAILAQGAIDTGDGAFAPIAAKNWRIRAEGETVAEAAVPVAEFFSERGLFYGIQFEDSPETDYWARYVEPVAQWRVFEFVSDGALDLELENMRLYALVLAPAEKVSREAFDRFLTDAQAARKAYFLKEHFKFEAGPPATSIAATEEQRKRGCVVFDRYWGSALGYRDVPGTDEVKPAAAAGARGERVPVVISAVALEALKGVSVSVSDLASESGGAIPASAVRVAAVRLKLRKGEGGYRLVPDVIQEQPGVDVAAGVTKTWWLTVAVPDDCAPGVYRGTVTIAPANFEATAVPLALTVHPFALAPVRMSIGLWYDDPSRLGYNTSLKGGVAQKRLYSHLPDADVPVTDEDSEVEAYRLRMLEADFACIAEHGFNGITMPPPRIKAISPEGETTVSYALVEGYVPLLRKYGINTDFPGQTYLLSHPIMMPGILVNRRALDEYTPLHAAAYADAVVKTRDFFKSSGINMLAYVVDEPREREINEWNRNLKGTMFYLDIVKRLGGWPTTVTTMRDAEDGVSYMPILEAEDVVQPHPGTLDRGSVEYARKTGKPLYFFNGSGFKRYPYGFYIWSQRPDGYWQWHYDWWNIAWNPVWEAHVGYAVYPSPNGPLSTPQFERAAQGIYDYRYALTLEDRIAEARASGKPDAAKAADEAAAYLDGIRAACTEFVLDDEWKEITVEEGKMVEWRSGIVERITAIQSVLR